MRPHDDPLPRPPLERVLETVLYVDDLAAAERFYGGILGLTRDSAKAGLFCFFRLEGAMLLLFEPEAARRAREVPGHGAIGPGHVCFSVAEHEHLWPRGGRSFYFRDPAGNSVELATPRIWGMAEPPDTRLPNAGQDGAGPP